MTSMLDPEVKPSPAREIVHKGKGCLAVLVAAAVLVFGGYLVWDRVGRLLTVGGDRRLPGSGQGQDHRHHPGGRHVGQIGDVLVESRVVQSEEAWNEAVDSEERSTSIQPGRYVMQTEMRAIDALTLLINPGESRVRSQFTVPEGLRLIRAGRRAGQGHQDQEVGVREGAEQAEERWACRSTRRTSPRASCSPTPTS